MVMDFHDINNISVYSLSSHIFSESLYFYKQIHPFLVLYQYMTSSLPEQIDQRNETQGVQLFIVEFIGSMCGRIT